MERAQKEALVAELHESLRQAESVIVTHYIGLNVAEISELRRQMRDAGARFRVTKNRLIRRAIEGTPYGPLIDLFDGPTAIAYADDPIAVAKATVDYSKKNDKLVVLGGAMRETPLDVDEVKRLAALPSLDGLRGMIAALLVTPATRVATVLQAPSSQLARVVAAYGNKGEQEQEPEADAS